MGTVPVSSEKNSIAKVFVEAVKNGDTFKEICLNPGNETIAFNASKKSNDY